MQQIQELQIFVNASAERDRHSKHAALTHQLNLKEAEHVRMMDIIAGYRRHVTRIQAELTDIHGENALRKELLAGHAPSGDCTDEADSCKVNVTVHACAICKDDDDADGNLLWLVC